MEGWSGPWEPVGGVGEGWVRSVRRGGLGWFLVGVGLLLGLSRSGGCRDSSSGCCSW